ncbi:hypothetical protein V5P93_003022 [Actinokineospora auranticolor]|nr:hypothetical protein [Actinokineospora auranticolor]
MTIVTLIAVFCCGAASAREGVARPSSAEYAAALNAARDPSAIGFAKTNFRQVTGADPASVTVADHGVAAYVLNPDFVRGDADAPAGVLQYIAVTATADNGTRATLRATPDAPGTWVVGSVFSGDDEDVMSKRLSPDSVLLNEPQINGWYELRPTGVVLLQASLPQNPVGALIPLAEYQKQVNHRYGDKLPGSDYEKRKGIGFDRTPPAEGWSTAAVVLTTIGAAVVLAATFFFWRRRYLARHRASATPTE